MGLDWRPIGKPKEGFEKEFEDLFYILGGKKKQTTTLIEKLRGIKPKSNEQLFNRFEEISIVPYITLNAPQVGVNESATKWCEAQYENRSNKDLTLDQFVESMKGYYALDLVPDCDGIPMYVAIHDERHVFRAKFLDDCQNILGPDLSNKTYNSKLASEAQLFGKEILEIGMKYAEENNCLYLKDQRRPPDVEEDRPEMKAHIILSAAKWLIWWSERGHGYEAYF
jgi:hypothetical protein